MNRVVVVGMGIIILWVALSTIGLLWVLISEIHLRVKEKNYGLVVFLIAALGLTIGFTIAMTGVIVGL